jgi:hypothetical protein
VLDDWARPPEVCASPDGADLVASGLDPGRRLDNRATGELSYHVREPSGRRFWEYEATDRGKDDVVCVNKLSPRWHGGVLRGAALAGQGRLDPWACNLARSIALSGWEIGVPVHEPCVVKVDGEAPVARRPRHYVQIVRVVPGGRTHNVVAARHKH